MGPLRLRDDNQQHSLPEVLPVPEVTEPDEVLLLCDCCASGKCGVGGAGGLSGPGMSIGTGSGSGCARLRLRMPLGSLTAAVSRIPAASGLISCKYKLQCHQGCHVRKGQDQRGLRYGAGLPDNLLLALGSLQCSCIARLIDDATPGLTALHMHHSHTMRTLIA